MGAPASAAPASAAPPLPARTQYDGGDEGYRAPARARGARASAASVPMGERSLVREELVETQEGIIQSLRTQLAAMTAILQQGVQIPLDGEIGRAALDGAAGHVQVTFDSKWQWRVEAASDAGGGELVTTHLGTDQRGLRPRRQ